MTNPVSNTDDFTANISKITPAIISSKIEQQTILAQSAMEGGPGDVSSVILHLMDSCKIGFRALSLETGLKRKPLQEMIKGLRPMPPEVVTKLYDVFKKRRPDLPWS